MPCHAMHPMQDYFWKDFYMHNKSICNLYALLYWQNFILAKSGCYTKLHGRSSTWLGRLATTWCITNWWGNTWLYTGTWCSSVLPSVKLDALHGSAIPAGLIFLLVLCNPPHRGCGEPAKPGLLYPLVWISCCGIVFVGVMKQSRLLNKWFGILGNVLWSIELE
jgi:hypothetical protein